MSAKQGAALQNYNNELVKCLEDLCERRAKLQADISQEEREKQSLEAQMNQVDITKDISQVLRLNWYCWFGILLAK